MKYMLAELGHDEDTNASQVGDYNLPKKPTIKQIVDAVSDMMSGEPADAYYDGRDPYDGTLVEVVDGWLVLGSNGEGDLYAVHAKRVED